MSLFSPIHTGPVPIYEQIRTRIQEQILSGAWSEQHKLLAEAELASELEVSRGTVCKAVAELTKEGLLVCTHGRRNFQAMAANLGTASHLSLLEKDPVMHIEQQTYLSDDQLVEFSDLWLRGDQFKLSAQVQRIGKSNTELAVDLLP